VLNFTKGQSEKNIEAINIFKFSLRDEVNNKVPSICDPRLLLALAAIQKTLMTKITITSGYRSSTTNIDSNGKLDSYHLNCSAVDFKVSGYTSHEVATVARIVINDTWGENIGGLGIYDDHIHLDLGERRVWDSGSIYKSNH